jgi:ribosomal protein S18 acetylase RimI-like enzyme
MPIVLEPSWVGQRVSIRRVVERDPSGRLLFSDVVGDLVGLDAQTAVIETRSTKLVEVPVALVAIAKLVPPSTADELTLQAVAAAGLRPAETAQLDGWRLRADDGFTRRSNSVLPLRQLRIPIDEALERAHDWYAERGLPLMLQLPVEGRRLLDNDLGERGFEPVDETSLLTTRLDHLSTPDAAAAPPVVLLDEPDDEWLSVYRGGAGLAPTGRALLARHDVVAFASLRLDGRTVAVGRGAVDDGWLGVMAIEVDPAHRRQGLAGTVMAALRGWGVSRGATRSYLQVGSANTAALALYDRLGYRFHHAYRYRIERNGSHERSVDWPHA